MATPPPNTYPKLAGTGRRVFHTVLAVVGWVLFVYWWWIVYRRVSPAEVRFTVLFIVIAVAVIVLLTILWVLHNKRLDSSRTARLHIKDDAHAAAHDSVGREMRMPDLSSEYQHAPVIRVTVEGGVKLYRVGVTSHDDKPGGADGSAS